MMAMAKRVFFFVTVNLLVMFTLMIAVNLISYFVFGGQPYANHYGMLAVFAAVWGMGGAFISLFMSKKMAKWMMGVRVIDPQTRDPELRELVTTVHNLARQARLPKMPEVGIYDSPELNAFATGPSKGNALVAVSRGLLQRMRREEVEGVLGHEVAHIANGDMVTMTLIQGIVNSFVIFFARVVASIVGSQVEERNRYMVEFGVAMLLQVLFGILGAIAVNYFSRMREFRADKGGARLAGREKMVSALRALAGNYDLANDLQDAPSMAALKISHHDKGMGFARLFMTHPPLDERIRRLEMGR